MSKFEIKAMVEKIEPDTLYGLRAGDKVLAGLSVSTDNWLYAGTITEVTPIMTAPDSPTQPEKETQ